jgi:SARP family transcriptional regulator, regulator of embCAB operon
MIQIEVLGPLVARYRARLLNLQPMQDVVILALWSAGIALTAVRLAELIWDIPTAGSIKTVHGHIRRIRGALLAAGGTTGGLVQTIRLGGGLSAYELVSEVRVDADEFIAAAAAGQQAYREGRYEQAAGCFRDARKLWRGEPLADARERPFARPAIMRLEEVSKEALITQQKTAVCLGAHREAIGELYPLTLRYPDEMEVWAALGVALYRSRRPGEAGRVLRQAVGAHWDTGLHDRVLQLLLDLQRDVLSGTFPMSGPLGF